LAVAAPAGETNPFFPYSYPPDVASMR
jgi:hypothetical protein